MAFSRTLVVGRRIGEGVAECGGRGDELVHAGLAEYGGACSPDMYTLGNAKMQELCAASNSPACDEGAPPGWFMETCPTSCGAC